MLIFFAVYRKYISHLTLSRYVHPQSDMEEDDDESDFSSDITDDSTSADILTSHQKNAGVWGRNAASFSGANRTSSPSTNTIGHQNFIVEAHNLSANTQSDAGDIEGDDDGNASDRTERLDNSDAEGDRRPMGGLTELTLRIERQLSPASSSSSDSEDREGIHPRGAAPLQQQTTQPESVFHGRGDLAGGALSQGMSRSSFDSLFDEAQGSQTL